VKATIPRAPALAGVVTLMTLGVGTSHGVSAQDAEASDLLEEAGAQYEALEGFCAEFSQTLFVPLLEETNRSRGSLCQARPNLFAMRFTEPDGDVLVSDGDWFWIYYPSSDPKQVLQFDMATAPGGLDFHREFLADPEERYDLSYHGEESVSGRTTQVVSLQPRESVGFREARIWLDVDRSLILQARITMDDGSVRTVTLSDIRLNPPEDPNRFHFSPPAGARVIRR